MTNYFVIIQIFILIKSLSAQTICPFSVCNDVSIDSYGFCSITCAPIDKKFPQIGPYTINTIESLDLENIEELPDDAFSNLKIQELDIDGLFLVNVSTNSFRGLIELHELDLSNFSYVLNFIDKLNPVRLQIKSLELETVGLQGLSIPQLFMFENLLYLHIENNSMLNIDLNLTTQWRNLSELDLTNNRIQSLKLTSETITQLDVKRNRVSLKTDILNLPNLEFLDLSGNVISGLAFDSFQNVSKIYKLRLRRNLIGSVDPQTFYNLNSLLELDLSLNSIIDVNFLLPESLLRLNLSSNLISHLTLENTKNFVNLISLDLSFNMIENVTFFYTDKLIDLDLSHNQIEFIQRESFSGLKQLRNLYLNHNRIFQIQLKSFQYNFYLNVLNVDDNMLEIIPDITGLENLNFLMLRSQTGAVVRIPNYAFERVESSQLDIYLNANANIEFYDKSFCSQYTNNFLLDNMNFYFGNLRNMNKCLLNQLTGSNISVSVAQQISCDLKLMADSLDINLVNSNFLNCTGFEFVDDCSLEVNRKFTCDLGLEEIYSTWIGFNFEVFSYRNHFQTCNLNSSYVCLLLENVQVICTRNYIIDVNRTVSVLSAIKINYIDNGQVLTYDLGLVFAPDFNQNNIFYYGNFSIQVQEVNENFKIFKDLNTQTEVYLIKYYSFYGVILKANHKMYSSLDGLLVDGC